MIEADSFISSCVSIKEMFRTAPSFVSHWKCEPITVQSQTPHQHEELSESNNAALRRKEQHDLLQTRTAKNNVLKSRHAGNNCWLRILGSSFSLLQSCRHLQHGLTMNNNKRSFFNVLKNLSFSHGTHLQECMLTTHISIKV